MNANTAHRAPGRTVYEQTATVPSNSSYGSSTIYARLYRERVLGPDDTVLVLCGGTFLLDGNELVSVRFTEPTRHPFERGGNDDSRLPLDEDWEQVPYVNGEISGPRRRDVPRLDSPPADAVAWGGLPDWLVPA